LADHILNTSPFRYLHRAGILRVMPAIFGRVKGDKEPSSGGNCGGNYFAVLTKR